MNSLSADDIAPYEDDLRIILRRALFAADTEVHKLANNVLVSLFHSLSGTDVPNDGLVSHDRSWDLKDFHPYRVS